MEPLGEIEADYVADVHRPTGPTTRVQKQTTSFRVVVEDKVKVAMREEDASTNEIRSVS